MSRLGRKQARALLHKLHGKKVLVVGDVMIDEWVWGTVTRISPEAPVPVVAVSNHSFTLGGAGNVASNLRALGADVSIVGTVGDDDFAGQVRSLLRKQKVDSEGLLALKGRPTTRKTRVVAHNQQVVRADWERVSAPAAAPRKKIVNAVRARARNADAVIFSDYGKGLLSRDIVDAASRCPFVLADPKPQNITVFAGVTCVAPNAAEASAITGIPLRGDDSVMAMGRALLRLLDCRYVVITVGEHGMMLFQRTGAPLNIPSVARTVFDVSGAGDTVIAVLALALAAGAAIEQAVELANFAAGAVVEKLGTATASADEILALVEHARA